MEVLINNCIRGFEKQRRMCFVTQYFICGLRTINNLHTFEMSNEF
jgi:hypothetical protein